MESPEQAPNLEQKKQELVAKLGSLLHDEWRAPRKQDDGSFEPRMKQTKDEKWIDDHNTDQVDIANTSYPELPEDWKGENRAAAEVAMSEVFKAVESGRELDDEFVEEASAVVHDKWLERNGEWAPDEQKKPYEELSEDEKEKDRAQVRKAIKIYRENK